MNVKTELQVDLRQMIIAIETAVSFVGMNDTNHGKRVGYIASQLAHFLGFNDQEIQFSFELGLLHDCGVSTEQMHSNLVNHFDWNEADKHCDIGYRLLKDFQPLAHYSVPILYHHTHWKELKNLDICRHDRDMANLIFLSDRIDVLAAAHYESDILLARKEIVHSITHYAGSFFNPKFVEAFEKLEKSEAFWISLEDRHITRYTWDMGQIESNKLLSLFQIKQLSLILAYIVDQKSPFTAQHSLKVADLAKHLSLTYGLAADQCEKVEIASLLHDLGKLHIPDNILEKNGPLNITERAIMNQHSYETYEILRHIKGLGELAQWAAFHHEGIDGSGYPFHPAERELSIEARVIAVADVFQALVQDRPYRQGMPLDKVVTILNELVIKGQLDKTIVELAKSNADDCYQIAKGEGKDNKQYFSGLFSDT